MTWTCGVCGYEHEGAAPPDPCPVCGAGAEVFTAPEEAAPASAMTTWVCAVCGHEHAGDAPPDTCPDCGAGAEVFAAKEPVAAAPVAATWTCGVCGYEHQGDGPPEACPVCGAGAEVFTSPEGGTTASRDPGFSGRLVVLGAGVAGVSAAEAARSQAPAADITLVDLETVPPYRRIDLTRFLAGAVGSEGLPLHDQAWYEEQRIARLSAQVTAIDTKSSVLVCDGRESVPFDRLVLATGAEPFVPPLEGADTAGVQCLRTLADAEGLLAGAGDERVVVVGGGVLGLECAGALAGRGRAVTVLERSPWLMSRSLDAGGGARLASFLEHLGIELRFGVSPSRLAPGPVVHLDDGSELAADRVVLCLGVRSETALARAAGLTCERGVVVDDLLATSGPGIWACGDCCEHRGRAYGLWTVARFQGAIAGANAVGGDTRFLGLEPAVALKVLDLPVVGIGRHQGEGVAAVVDDAPEAYRALYRDGTRLVGAVLVGDASASGLLAKAIEDRREVPGNRVDEVVNGLR